MAENIEKVTQEYDAGQIQVLEGLEAVRKRPGMYIGDTGTRGLHHLVYEVVDNSVDEAMAGFCDKIQVTIHTDESITIQDNGRGIPTDPHPYNGRPTSEVVLTVLHAGGKFGDGAYKVSGGLHGVGVSVVNALSEWLIITIARDGLEKTQRFERGVPVTDLTEGNKADWRGTRIHYMPDREIFEDVHHSLDTLKSRFRELAFLNPGLKISVHDERTNESREYFFTGGIGAFVQYIDKDRNALFDSPIVISGSINNISINASKKFHWIKKNKSLKEYNMLFNNLNAHNSQNHYDYSSNSTYSNYNTIKKIKEKDLFEQSAITIQSVFRGYLMKSKLEAYLIKYKDYNRALEILEKTIKSYLDKSINIGEENQKFFNLLKENNKNNENNENKNINCKSCKTFKLLNLPSTPSSEKNDLNKKFYMNLFLHKEIGERFNIIKENKQKEIEQKYKEEIDNINNKVDKLIKENKSLKDINEKNKYKESKFKELSMENKKKENIINIITNDNQNLARRLKLIQDKFNQLEIHNQINFCYNSENSQYNNSKELFIEYRNFYLLFLIHKKNAYCFDLLRKYFNKYRNIINSLKENEKDNTILKEQKIKLLAYDKKNKEYLFLKDNFRKFYYKGLLIHREIQNREDILRTKLKNIILIKTLESFLFFQHNIC